MVVLNSILVIGGEIFSLSAFCFNTKFKTELIPIAQKISDHHLVFVHIYWNVTFSNYFQPIENMKSLKINLEENADLGKISELLILIRGIKSVEFINEESSESDLKKAVTKSKEQLKSGDYESFVNDLFETFVNKKS